MVNRLIIIGNGFDLAHGLKTRYTDFLENYYNSISGTELNDDFFHIKWLDKILKLRTNQKLSSFEDLEKLVRFACRNGNFYVSGEEFFYDENLVLSIKNSFFKYISDLVRHGWVDIEYEYFQKILETLDSFGSHGLNEIRKLNLELDQIGKKLEEYLVSTTSKSENAKELKALSSIFKSPNLGNEEGIERFLSEFNFGARKGIEENILYGIDRRKGNPFFPFRNSLILNFNYTATAKTLYQKSLMNATFKDIHGTLGSRTNPIIFGYGDEMNKSYSQLEDLNDNEYLRLMKSSHYTNNGTYREIMDFIESDIFQIQIMGHSCGISDRTLLSTLFEHKNCQSIKVFYHQFKDDKTEEISDNFSEIVMNISRHFKDKISMRSKIVSKDLCQPLPQFND